MKIAHLIYKILAWLLLVCIVVQIYIAGMATFSDPMNWEKHKMFANFFAMIPLIMFLLTFIGGIKGRVRRISLGLFWLIVFQFLTIHVFSSVFVIAAFHPVIAMLLFWGSLATVRAP